MEISKRKTGRISVFDPIADRATSGDGQHFKPKILALCGAKSNNAVTCAQLENLHVTPGDSHDVHFLHGPILEEEGDPTLEGLFHGPFYSWIDTSSREAIDESVVNSVRLVMKANVEFGPFDGIYGFSNGEL